MRTAAIEFAEDVQQRGIDPVTIDALFVTSLMSAADLRALLPAGFCDKPMVLYMHENQAAYPAADEAGADPRDVHFLLTNLTSCAAADHVLWNSAWNQQSFHEGAAKLLAHSRDGRLNDVLPAIMQRSEVAWPPVEDLLASCFQSGSGNRHGDEDQGTRSPPDSACTREQQDPPRRDALQGEHGDREVLHNPIRVVWPHRWEHDKGPDALLDLARRYTCDHNLRWIILGEQFDRIPPAMQAFTSEFRDRIDHMGYVEDRRTYLRWLSRADWVLSTARHEFFGIAVVEALLAGALPWLPTQLSYPELLPAEAHGLSPMNPPDDPDTLRNSIREHLQPALAHNAVRRIDAAIEQQCARA